MLHRCSRSRGTSTLPPPPDPVLFSALTRRRTGRCCALTCVETLSRQLAGTGAHAGGRVLMAVLMVIVATVMNVVLLTMTHRSSSSSSCRSHMTLVSRLIHVFQITGNALVLLNTIDDHSSSVTAGTIYPCALIHIHLRWVTRVCSQVLLRWQGARLLCHGQKRHFQVNIFDLSTRLGVMRSRAILSQSSLRHATRHAHSRHVRVVAAAHAPLQEHGLLLLRRPPLPLRVVEERCVGELPNQNKRTMLNNALSSLCCAQRS